MRPAIVATLATTGFVFAVFAASHFIHPPLQLPDKHAYVCASIVRPMMRSPESFRVVSYSSGDAHGLELSFTPYKGTPSHKWGAVGYYSINAFGASLRSSATCIFKNEPMLRAEEININGKPIQLTGVDKILASSVLPGLRYDRLAEKTGPWKWWAWYAGTPAIDIDPP